MSADELLDIVDKDDLVIGQDMKQNKLDNNLISRNVVIYLKDKDGHLLVTKRSISKSTFPSCFDTSCCGNVKAGESYEEAARRELREELGVECIIKFVRKTFTEMTHKGKPLQFFTAIFVGYHDGEIQLNEELESYQKIHLDKLKHLMLEKPDLFVPAFRSEVLEHSHLL